MYRVFGLLLILALAFYMAFIPHIGYAYPLHGDEWMHMTYAETIAGTGSITFPDPFTGLTDIKLGANLWVGYHTLWAMFQQASGIDWIILFRYFPSIIFMLTVLAVYILAFRQGYGLEAAFFACLIPTTGGLLGPAFMVPMALAMFFIPLSLFLAFNIKLWPSYLLIFLFTCFLLISHATTAIVLCIILAPYILLNIKGNIRHSTGVLAALVLPFALSLPWTFQIAVQTAGQLLVPQYFSPYIELPDLLWTFGLLPIVFSFIGTVILVMKGGKKNMSLVLGLALLLIIMLVFIRFHYGLSTVYQRGLTAMLLILSILAGAGLLWVRKLKLPANFLVRYKSILLRNVTTISCVSLVVLILAAAIPTRLNAVFYHMIDNEDYRAFTWIKDNVAEDYSTAVLDPWKATAFSAVTGKKVLHRIWPNQDPVDDRIYSYLKSGCQYSTFLRDNKVSFIYNQLPCDNRDLIEVSNRVFVTNPNISATFAANDQLQNAGFEAVYGHPPVYWGKVSQNCKPTFLYPEAGRIEGASVAIRIMELAPFSPWPQAIWTQNIPVQSGKSYIVGGWIKSEDIEGKGGAMITTQWKGPGNKWISQTAFMPYLKGATGWTYYQGNVTAPPGATTCTVCCQMGGCSGTAWYDDISFKEK
ncbi:MAG: glycosyltransferase family protein [Dehalococcoidia bacterium]